MCLVYKGLSAYRAMNTVHLRLYKTNLLVSYKKKVAVCSEIHTENTHTQCKHHTKFLILELVLRKVTLTNPLLRFVYITNKFYPGFILKTIVAPYNTQ